MVGQLLSGISNFHQWDELPNWLHVLPIARWTGVVYCYAALLMLLIPWRPSRRAWMIPVSVCVSFYALCGIIGLINANALHHGLSSIAVGCMLKPASMRDSRNRPAYRFCYGVAATVILYTGWRTAVLTLVATCVVYTLLMFYRAVSRSDHRPADDRHAKRHLRTTQLRPIR